MNYSHCNDPYPFPAAVTWWESHADDLSLMAESNGRAVKANQLVSEAVAFGAQILELRYEVRDKLEDLQLRADELANNA
jgi:hypothetical protein